jgi:hypothetical protein
MKLDYFKCLDILALVIQLSGAIMMFLNSPNNTSSIDPLLDDYEEEAQPIEDKKNKRLKQGFLLLLIGILITLISTVIK